MSLTRSTLIRDRGGKNEQRKLTAAERVAKELRRREFETVLIGGKMKRVRRPPPVEGMDAEEFIRRNADPMWLHQNEMWEYIQAEPPADWPSDDSTDEAIDG